MDETDLIDRTLIDELKGRLLKLPRRSYGKLIQEIDAERLAAAEREDARNPLRADMTRDEFAYWIARQHHDVDSGLTRILYLPTDAPPDEVRLLECNILTPLSDEAPIRAFDFRVPMEEVDFNIYVADVSPRQFEDVLDRRAELPRGMEYRRLP